MSARSDRQVQRPRVNVAAIAEYLGTTERHVRRLVAERRIPYVKVGGLVRFDLDAIDRWLDDHTHEPISPPPHPLGRITPIRSNSRRRSGQTAPTTVPGQLRLDA